jgi:ribosomal protein L11 methyltransferase
MYGRIFSPFTVGRFIILPEGEPPPPESGILLIMGKKGAFGSGEHETTASCLEELERLPGIEGMRCLDLGSGTGILSIAAVKLGAGTVVAIDIAPAAAASCAANVRLNGMEERVLTVCGELGCLKENNFDLIMANIYADIHLALAGEMVARTRPGGFLLLSGIPVQDNYEVQLRFRREGCELMDSRFMEEYVTFLFRKSPTPELDPPLVVA